MTNNNGFGFTNCGPFGCGTTGFGYNNLAPIGYGNNTFSYGNSPIGYGYNNCSPIGGFPIGYTPSGYGFNNIPTGYGYNGGVNTGYNGQFPVSNWNSTPWNSTPWNVTPWSNNGWNTSPFFGATNGFNTINTGWNTPVTGYNWNTPSTIGNRFFNGFSPVGTPWTVGFTNGFNGFDGITGFNQTFNPFIHTTPWTSPIGFGSTGFNPWLNNSLVNSCPSGCTNGISSIVPGFTGTTGYGINGLTNIPGSIPTNFGYGSTTPNFGGSFNSTFSNFLPGFTGYPINTFGTGGFNTTPWSGFGYNQFPISGFPFNTNGYTQNWNNGYGLTGTTNSQIPGFGQGYPTSSFPVNGTFQNYPFNNGTPVSTGNIGLNREAA